MKAAVGAEHGLAPMDGPAPRDLDLPEPAGASPCDLVNSRDVKHHMAVMGPLGKRVMTACRVSMDMIRPGQG